MEVCFQSQKLAKICNDQRALIATYGIANAKKIMLRLNELQSVDNLSQVPTTPPSRCHSLAGQRKGQFAVDVKQPYRLIFRPDGSSLPMKSSGELDWTKITSIIIIEIGDYHD